MNPFDLEGKLVLITGSTRGIGLGAAHAFRQCGAQVILVGRNQADLKKAAATLGDEDRKVHIAPFDLLKTNKIASWIEDLCDRLGVPDVVINSAGMTRRGQAIDLSLDDWNDVLALNTTAMFEVNRSYARRRIAEGGGGRIINIASLMTAAARPGTSPYTASKGAVGQLTKALAVEWASYGILVNAIAPGYIDTDLNKSLVSDQAFDQWVKTRCPLGRWGVPMDVAWPIVFLASPAAGFITGQVIFVDGGWLATF